MSELALLGGSPVHTQGWPSWPVHDQLEEDAVLGILRSGAWWQHSHGQGVELTEDPASASAVSTFERAFAAAHQAAHGICAANGSVTMEIALRAAGVSPGDEVIVPAYTYVATATAPLMIGAVPIFVDIEPDTYNIDLARLEAAITPRTRAIIPVHFGGQPCDMDGISALAKAHDLVVLEDAAHAHGASFRGIRCGALGDLASFSFQHSKNMTAGEGGIITTNDAALAERCESLVWAGRKRGMPWYSHYELASNARMTEFQAAILSAQLTRLDAQVTHRAGAAAALDRLLGGIDGIEPLARRATTTEHAYHIYMFRYDPEHFAGLAKGPFVEAMQAEGIPCFGGYEWPLYANPMFREKRFMGGAYPLVKGVYDEPLDYEAFADVCPVAERASRSEAVWIPQSMLLADAGAIADIATAIEKVKRCASEVPRAVAKASGR